MPYGSSSSSFERKSPARLLLLIAPLVGLVLWATVWGTTGTMASASKQAGGSSSLNVLKTPLTLFSRSPMTGFYRDGYCRTGPSDGGNHAVAGILTKEFLDFTASRGNNLRAAGLEPGCKWCLCTARWKEAVDAVERGQVTGAPAEKVVPKVVLQATEDSALRNGISIDVLRKYAVDEQANGAGRGGGEL